MKKIASILLLICTFTFLSFTTPEKVMAASAKITVTGSKTVVVGNTVKVTFTISSSSALGSWAFDVKYDSSKLTYVSSTLEGSTRAVNAAQNGKLKTKTYTMTFKAKSSGTATISVKNAEVVGWDDEKNMSVSNGSMSIKIITQKELQDSYSSNNNLKSLSVDGYDLNPKFNKSTLEYSLELENDIRSIKVNASKEDSKASIKGGGTYSLEEGDNDITITVTAENGNAKRYIIHATVKELNPIFVTVDDKEYSVVRKKEGLTIPSTFSETTTLINGEEVPAFESSITGYRIVALRDEVSTNFYIMEEDGSYTKYEELIFGGITLYPLTPDPSELEKYDLSNGDKVLYGEKEIESYSSSKSSYPLIYGVNVQTGKTNWYSYDAEEETLQRLEDMKVEENSVNDKYLFLIAVLSGSIFILLVFMIILYGKTRKYKKIKEESL